MRQIRCFKFILPLFFIGAQSLFAQNWSPFPGDWEYVFGRAPSGVKPEGLTVIGRDSLVLEGGDWVTYFNRISQVADGDTACDAFGAGTALEFLPDQDNLLGKKMIARPGGVYEFVYTSGDTVRIETQAPLLSTFTFHADSGVTATVSDRYAGFVLGVMDSILTLNLSNGRQVELSKNHGLIKAYDFVGLPELDGLPGKRVMRNMLIRHLDSLPDMENHPEFDDVFNFGVGDHFQLLKHFTGGSGEYFEWKDYTILTRTVNSDSSLFTYDMTEKKKKALFTGSTWDTIYYPAAPILVTFSAFDYKHLDSLLPGEMDDEVFYQDGIHAMPDWSMRLGLGFIHKDFMIYDTCANGYYNFEGMKRSKYGDGLGRVSYLEVGLGNVLTENLVCYRKATDSAGVCEDVTIGVSDAHAPYLLKVWPNPVQGTLQVWVPAQVGGVRWSLTDLLGREVLHGAAANDWSVDVSGLSRGVYVFQAVAANGATVSRKVVKE
jgi:hypothetical protein